MLPEQPYVSPGNLGWTRIAGCHSCGWAEEHDRAKAYKLADEHRCEVTV